METNILDLKMWKLKPGLNPYLASCDFFLIEYFSMQYMKNIDFLLNNSLIKIALLVPSHKTTLFVYFADYHFN